MRRITVLIAALLFAGLAHAGSIDGSVSHPTKNTDGSTIAASGPGALDSFRVEYGTCVGLAFGSVIASQVVLYPATAFSFGNVAPGLLCLRAFWLNNVGGESVSSTVSFAGPAPNPGSIVVVSVSAP